MSIRLLFEPRDLWLGVFWDRRVYGLVVYVCLVPMVPLRLDFIRPSLRKRSPTR